MTDHDGRGLLLADHEADDAPPATGDAISLHDTVPAALPADGPALEFHPLCNLFPAMAKGPRTLDATRDGVTPVDPAQRSEPRSMGVSGDVAAQNKQCSATAAEEPSATPADTAPDVDRDEAREPAGVSQLLRDDLHRRS